MSQKSPTVGWDGNSRVDLMGNIDLSKVELQQALPFYENFQMFRMLERLWLALRDSLSHFIEYSMQAVCSLLKAGRGPIIYC
jgi:hypothetical protein